MTSSDISNRIYSNGLRKALIGACDDIVLFYLRKIEEEPLTVPDNVLGWRRGSFSWLYVRAVECWSNVMFQDLEMVAMAQKRGNKNKAVGLQNYTFVRCELDAESKKLAKIWIEKNTPNLGVLLHDVMASEYKFSCSFSSEHDTFTATLTGKEGAINAFKTITARHKDWIFATMTLLYKHTVMLGGEVWEQDEDAEDGWA